LEPKRTERKENGIPYAINQTVYKTIERARETKKEKKTPFLTDITWTELTSRDLEKEGKVKT